MAFFRSFLIENKQEPDTRFDEQDEAALVWFLLQSRAMRSAVGLTIPPDFEAPDRIPPNLQAQLKFVSGFLCFFVSKPMGYLREMRAFRDYFVPGFARDTPKQIQLGQALHEKFFTASLSDLEQAETLDLFFDVEQLMVTP